MRRGGEDDDGDPGGGGGEQRGSAHTHLLGEPAEGRGEHASERHHAGGQSQQGAGVLAATSVHRHLCGGDARDGAGERQRSLVEQDAVQIVGVRQRQRGAELQQAGVQQQAARAAVEVRHPARQHAAQRRHDARIRHDVADLLRGGAVLVVEQEREAAAVHHHGEPDEEADEEHVPYVGPGDATERRDERQQVEAAVVDSRPLRFLILFRLFNEVLFRLSPFWSRLLVVSLFWLSLVVVSLFWLSLVVVAVTR